MDTVSVTSINRDPETSANSVAIELAQGPRSWRGPQTIELEYPTLKPMSSEQVTFNVKKQKQHDTSFTQGHRVHRSICNE